MEREGTRSPAHLTSQSGGKVKIPQDGVGVAHGHVLKTAYESVVGVPVSCPGTCDECGQFFHIGFLCWLKVFYRESTMSGGKG